MVNEDDSRGEHLLISSRYPNMRIKNLRSVSLHFEDAALGVFPWEIRIGSTNPRRVKMNIEKELPSQKEEKLKCRE